MQQGTSECWTQPAAPRGALAKRAVLSWSGIPEVVWARERRPSMLGAMGACHSPRAGTGHISRQISGGTPGYGFCGALGDDQSRRGSPKLLYYYVVNVHPWAVEYDHALLNDPVLVEDSQPIIHV